MHTHARAHRANKIRPGDNNKISLDVDLSSRQRVVCAANQFNQPSDNRTTLYEIRIYDYIVPRK